MYMEIVSRLSGQSLSRASSRPPSPRSSMAPSPTPSQQKQAGAAAVPASTQASSRSPPASVPARSPPAVRSPPHAQSPPSRCRPQVSISTSPSYLYSAVHLLSLCMHVHLSRLAMFARKSTASRPSERCALMMITPTHTCAMPICLFGKGVCALIPCKQRIQALVTSGVSGFECFLHRSARSCVLQKRVIRTSSNVVLLFQHVVLVRLRIDCKAHAYVESLRWLS
jgi:hypothetical protein